MKEFVETLWGLIAIFGIKVLAAIAILVIGLWFAKLLPKVVRKAMTEAKIEATLVSFLSNVTYIAAVIFVLLAALNQLGVQTTSIIALLGAAGLAIGLALQGSLANFAAGVLIVFFRPFRVEDWIEAAGVSGIVEEIHIFTTTVRTFDNRTIIVPNAKLSADNITNYSAKPYLRLDLVVGVAYDADVDRVKQVLARALAEDERILQHPAPDIGVLELGDSSVNFAVRPWVRPSDYWQVSLNTYDRIKKCLDAEGISIPFPQRDIHLYQRQAA